MSYKLKNYSKTLVYVHFDFNFCYQIYPKILNGVQFRTFQNFLNGTRSRMTVISHYMSIWHEEIQHTGLSSQSTVQIVEKRFTTFIVESPLSPQLWVRESIRKNLQYKRLGKPIKEHAKVKTSTISERVFQIMSLFVCILCFSLTQRRSNTAEHVCLHLLSNITSSKHGGDIRKL